MEEPQLDPLIDKKPYLRRGSGWEARMQAAREGRRYRPKGGAVHDYTTEPALAGPPARRSPSKAVRNKHKAAGAAAAKPATARQQLGGLLLSNSSRQAARAPHPGGAAPSLQPTRDAGNLQLASMATSARLAGTWVPMGTSAPPTPRVWGGNDTKQDLELEEFCALESEVLREVSNHWAQPGSGSPLVVATKLAQRSPRAAGLAADQCSAASNFPRLQPGQSKDEEDQEEEEEEDVFQSDREGLACNTLRPAQQPRAHAKSVSFAESSVLCPATSMVIEEEDEEGELDAQSELIDEVPLKPTSSLVQKFFYSQKAEKPAPPAPEGKAPEDLLQKQVEELEEQVRRLNEERAKVAQQRRQVEDARARLEQDKSALERRKAEELAQIEAMRMEEQRKLQRDRRVLEKQSRALLKLPTKREKEETQALEALLEKERQNSRGKDARQKLTVDRLRRQILDLQEKNRELQEQVHFLELQRLQHWDGGQGGSSPVKRSMPSPGQREAAAGSRRAATEGLPPRARGGQDQAFRPGGPGRTQPALEGQAAGEHAAGNRLQQCGEGALWQGVDTSDDSDLEFGEDGHVVAEELDAAVLVDTLPTVRVSAHQPHHAAMQAQQRPAQGSGLPSSLATASHRLSLEGSVQTPPAPAAPAPQPPVTDLAAASQAEAVSVMHKATTALHRFNQLKQSLLQHGGLQQKLSSRLSSLQASPAAGSALMPSEAEQQQSGFAVQQPVYAAQGAVATAAASESRAGGMAANLVPQKMDDLRALGRMLTSSMSQEMPCHASVGHSMPHGAVAQQQPRAFAAAAAPDMPQATESAGASMACAAAPSTPQHAVVSEQRYGDGRLERVYASGTRVQEFPNGSRKQHWPDGRSATCFENGDVKKTWPDGRVEYYYAAVGCWHVTHANSVEVFHFASGQIEAHYPGGVKEIVFPDGAMKKVLPDGRELAITAMHLSKEIQIPQPERAITTCA